MKSPRVLVVDDSAVVRRSLRNALLLSGVVEEVEVAASGRIALSSLEASLPDVVILDVIMPGMDGLEVLKEIRTRYGALPVIMFSSVTRHAARETIAALSLGASDYVRKPSKMEGIDPEAAMQELIPRIIALTRPPTPRSASAPPPPSVPSSPPVRMASAGLAPERARQPIEIVVIGVSTGGPQALERVVGALPGALPVPIVIVQHMPPLFTGYLAQRLDTISPLHVREAADGDLLEPGGVWLAPGGLHMGVVGKRWRTTVRLLDTPPENSCKPSVDVLLRSVVDVYGGRALGVILTGMGQDGLRGCLELHAAGGLIFAQDEASSVVWGMPRAVVEGGCADRVVPLSGMAESIRHAVQTHRSRERDAS